MKLINRCVLMLKPKPPFIEWVTSLGVELPEDWDFEGGAYLVDEQESEKTLNSAVAYHARAILENEFAAWEEDSSLWPQDRSFTLLTSWFHLHYSVAGFDIGSEQLMRADLAGVGLSD